MIVCRVNNKVRVVEKLSSPKNNNIISQTEHLDIFSNSYFTIRWVGSGLFDLLPIFILPVTNSITIISSQSRYARR